MLRLHLLQSFSAASIFIRRWTNGNAGFFSQFFFRLIFVTSIMAHNIGDCQVLPGTIRYSGHAANATQHLDLILSVSVFQI